MDKINFDGYLAPITGQAFGTIFEVSARSVDRKSVVQGKSVDLGGRRIIKKKSEVMEAFTVVYVKEFDCGYLMRKTCWSRGFRAETHVSE